jgi:hypothetical protein
MKNQLHKGNPHANTYPERIIEFYTFGGLETQLFDPAPVKSSSPQCVNEIPPIGKYFPNSTEMMSGDRRFPGFTTFKP